MQTSAHLRTGLTRPLQAQINHQRLRHKSLLRAEGSDSYQKVETPSRKAESVPKYEERTSKFDDTLTSSSANPDKAAFGTEVGVTDAMRFQGAAPELINSRAAMLGFALAVAGYLTTGKNVWEQFAGWPGLVFGTFGIIAIASLIPITRGLPRTDFGPFKATSEVYIGRLAMLGMVGLFWIPFLGGYHLWSVQ